MSVSDPVPIEVEQDDSLPWRVYYAIAASEAVVKDVKESCRELERRIGKTSSR